MIEHARHYAAHAAKSLASNRVSTIEGATIDSTVRQRKPELSRLDRVNRSVWGFGDEIDTGR